MKTAQKVALVLGVFYVAIGIAGFASGLVTQPAAVEAMTDKYGYAAEYGYLFGLLPVNDVLNVIHITTGAFGIATAISLDSSRFFAGQIGIYYTVLTVLGLIPIADTFFGVFPLFGANVPLHAITALLGIGFGFLATPSLLNLLKRELKEDADAAEIL